MIPRLHVVTDDEVLADPGFGRAARSLAASFGDAVAIHLRGHRTAARRLHDLAAELVEATARSGTPLLVADRVDVALSLEGVGVRLGERSLPVSVARAIIGDRTIAASIHSPEGAREAAADGADLLVLGTIWATPSHPGRAGSGPAAIREVAARVGSPIIAIGGVTPERCVEALEAGAAGVAVLRGIWSAGDPRRAAESYLSAMERTTMNAAGARS